MNQGVKGLKLTATRPVSRVRAHTQRVPWAEMKKSPANFYINLLLSHCVPVCTWSQVNLLLIAVWSQRSLKTRPRGQHCGGTTDQRKLPWDQPSRTSHALQACIIRQRDRASERIEEMALDTVPDWGASQSQHTPQVGKVLHQKTMRLESRDGIGPEYLVRNSAQRQEIEGQSGRGSQPRWAVTSDNQVTIWPSLTRLNQSNKDSTPCNTDWNAKATHTLYGWHPRTNHSAHG